MKCHEVSPQSIKPKTKMYGSKIFKVRTIYIWPYIYIYICDTSASHHNTLHLQMRCVGLPTWTWPARNINCYVYILYERRTKSGIYSVRALPAMGRPPSVMQVCRVCCKANPLVSVSKFQSLLAASSLPKLCTPTELSTVVVVQVVGKLIFHGAQTCFKWASVSIG